MMIRRSRPSILAVAALALMTVNAHAKCAGTDMLPAIQKDHPEIYGKIRSKASAFSNANAVLWKIERPGIAPSYLLGTMHVTDPRIAATLDDVQDKIRSSKTLAVEVKDIGPSAIISVAAQSPELLLYTDGTTLQQKLTPTEFDKLKVVFSSAGLPERMALMVRPWFASILLSMPACEQAAIAAGDPALDSRIESIAKKNNVPVTGLETAADQLHALAGMPEQDQIAMLKTALYFTDKREDIFETLIQSYLNRDIGLVLALSAALGEIAGRKNSGHEAIMRDLIVKRNKTMFTASRSLVDAGNAVIAVGAAHLIGKTGLVAAYRDAGFKVTAIR